MEILIYTDGSCLGNPGPGGWAAIIIEEDKEKKIHGGEKLTTNNRMELTAAIKALEYYEMKKGEQPSLNNIKIFTDSNYVKDGITKWIKNWKKNNWKTSAKKPVKNQELWEKLDKLVKFHDVKWEWIKGHSTNIYNNLADELAKKAAEKN